MMKKFFLNVIFCLMCGLVYSSLYAVQLSQEQRTGGLFALACPDNTHCIALLNREDLTNHNHKDDVIYYSENSGRSWLPAKLSKGEASGLYSDGLKSISCQNDGHCIGVGSRRNKEYGERQASVYYSEDFGKTWVGKKLDNPERAVDWSLNKVACMDNAKCLAVGQYSMERSPAPSFFLTYTSSDFGKSWDLLPPRDVMHSPKNASALSCFSGGWCLMAADNKIYYNNGHSDMPNNTAILLDKNTSSLPGIHAFTCDAQKFCIAVGGVSRLVDGDIMQMKGVIYYSHDFGKTWTTSNVPEAPAFISQIFQHVSCRDHVFCIAVGSGAEKYYSYDLGQHWLVENTEDENTTYFRNWYDVGCSSDLHCVVVGDALVQQGVRVPYSEYTEDGGKTWQPSIKLPKKKDPERVYPLNQENMKYTTS